MHAKEPDFSRISCENSIIFTTLSNIHRVSCMYLLRPTGIARNVGHPSGKMHASTGGLIRIEYANVLFRAFRPSTL